MRAEKFINRSEIREAYIKLRTRFKSRKLTVEFLADNIFYLSAGFIDHVIKGLDKYEVDKQQLSK